MLDALLHEQNRDDREQAYADIEDAIDGAKKPNPVVVRPMWPKRLGIVAAAVALCAGVVLWMNSSRENEMVILEHQRSSEQESALLEVAIETQDKRILQREELKAAIREQEAKVEDRRNLVTAISRTKEIIYFADRSNESVIRHSRKEPSVAYDESQPSHNPTSPAVGGQGAVYTMNEYNRRESEVIQLETQIESLLKYDSEQLLIYASGLDLPDNIIRNLYPQYLELKRQIDGLKASGLGDRHPTIQTNQRVFESMKNDLEEGVVNLRTRLQGRLETAKVRLEKVESLKNETKRNGLEPNTDTQDYVNAKRDFEAHQKRLELLKLKLIATENAEGEESLVVMTDQLQRKINALELSGIPGAIPKANTVPEPPAFHLPLPEISSQIENLGRYAPLIDPTWERPTQTPLSTFSIDVDTASYANIRRMIREGRNIPADAVRIEECINAFKYSYEPPVGNRAFAVHTELVTCPWNENNLLVKFGIKGREIVREKRPVSNLVFLIDVSGSMQASNKLPLVKESLKLLLHQLDERDSVSYVVYAGSEGVVLPPTKMTESGRVQALQALESLESGGSTNGGAGIKRAYELASENFIDGGVNRVVLASDGDFNVGVTGNDALVSLVKERAAKNIYLSALAFGTGNLNDAMFEAISNDGNGNYFYIDGIRESRKVFLENLTGSLITIAKDVKIQVEFNPGKVGSYRLIGYANRVLKDEDFNNDKFDAGDIGAGHTVTAFYEIVPAGAPQPNGGGVDSLKYQEAKPDVEAPVVPSDEWLTLKLRHKHPEGDISALQETVLKGQAMPWHEAGSDFQFATAVAMFGMKLRGMPDFSEIPWESVSQLAKPGLKDDRNEDRAEFVDLIGELKRRSR